MVEFDTHTLVRAYTWVLQLHSITLMLHAGPPSASAGVSQAQHYSGMGQGLGYG